MVSYLTFVPSDRIYDMQLIKLIFWISFFAVLYSYIIYPLFLKLLSLFKKPNSIIYLPSEDLPKVSILIAAFNEEKVIREKIESVLKSNYPASSIEIIVGSDSSTDLTNSIVEAIAAVDSRVSLVEFNQRSGKVTIINVLVKLAINPVLILTDANVIFSKITIYELVKHFKNDSIALVDSNMVNTGIKKDGISLQEKSYISAEVYIKHYEGLLWGTMMGPFGGCFALRKSSYSPVPAHFLVDDFYLNMKVLQSGGKCINELNARVYEDVSNEAAIEFNRKIRIAAGSFQNLFLFLPSLLRINTISFCFFSHKVLRWKGPFFILFFYTCSILLYDQLFFRYFCWLTTFIICTPLIDYLLHRVLRINLLLLRFPAHFITTNMALLFGFFRYIIGIQSGIWQPTKRHQ